jgi:hypothetical protein
MRERWGFWLKRLPTADSESLPTVLVAAMPRCERGCLKVDLSEVNDPVSLVKKLFHEEVFQ